MKNVLLFCVLGISGVFAQAPQIRWMNDVGEDAVKKRIIAAGAKGDVFAIYTRSTMNPVESIERYDSTGALLWSQGCYHFWSMKARPDNHLVLNGLVYGQMAIGSQTANTFPGGHVLALLNENGMLKKYQMLTENYAAFGHFDINAAGETFVVGSVKDSVQLGNQTLVNPKNYMSYFIAKLDTAFNFVSSYLLDVGPGIGIGGLIVDKQSNVLISGYFTDSLVIGNQVLLKTYGGGDDGFILRLNATGQPTWKKQLHHAMTVKMHIDANNELYVGGLFSDTLKIDQYQVINPHCNPGNCQSSYAAKIKTNGQLAYLTQVLGEVYDSDVSPDGYFYITGETMASLRVGTDTVKWSNGQYSTTYNPFLCRLGHNGKLDWALIPENVFCAPNDLTIGNLGHIYWTGFAEKIAIGSYTVSDNTFPHAMFLALFSGKNITAGISEKSVQNTHMLWPNPSSGELYHNFPEGCEACIYDLTGRCVLRRKILETETFDLHTLEKGIYLIESKGASFSYSARIILE
jgi:hypothetical protein